MKHRMSLLLLVCTFLLALVPGTSAQDSDCLNLSEADCAVLQAADANSTNINSFLLNFAVDFTLGGLESFDPSAAGGVELHVTGQGPVVALGEPDATAADLSAILSAIETQLDINASIKAPDTAESVTLGVVVDGGSVYVQDPESGQWCGWTGDVLAEQLTQFSGMMGSMGGMNPSTMSDPSAMMGQMPPELMTAIMSTDWEALAQTPGFLNYQRLADEQLMGQAMSPFEFTADFGLLFKSPEFQNAVNQIVQASAQMSTSGDSQSTQQAQMAAMMVPMFLNSTTGTFSVTQWVGTTDQFIHQLAVDLNGTVDLSALGAMSGDSSAAQMQPITIDFHFEVGLDQINGTFDVAAPAGARLLSSADEEC